MQMVNTCDDERLSVKCNERKFDRLGTKMLRVAINEESTHPSFFLPSHF